MLLTPALLFSAVLFTIGKFAIGIYLGTIGSSYGAAAPVIIILLWTYYSAQIFFFGAELTQAYASQRGSKIRSGNETNASESGARPRG